MENEQNKRQDTMVESIYTKSADGKWLIHKTIITDIKPMTYMNKVIGIDKDPEVKEESI